MNAVVAGLPRSWQTAPSITAICCGRGRSSMRVRAWSIDLQRVHPDVALRMPLGLLRAADERLQLRETAVATTPRSSASAKPIDGRGANSSFSISPQIRSAGRSSSGIARHSARVPSSSVELEPRGELHRAQHAQAVVGERRGSTTRSSAALEIAAAVERIEVLVGQRIPRDRVDR